MHELYEMADSGNCYKVRLLLHQLNVPYRRHPTDILRGASRTPQFLSLNPNGKVPLLILPDGRPLAESNAMLCYLAEGTDLLPDDRYQRALVLQWLFFEQYSHEPYIATNRFWLHLLKDPQTHADRIAANQPRGVAALQVMDDHLGSQRFFVGNSYSIADIALYAYTHVAGEGGYDLEPFPNITRWLGRVADQPRHIPIHA